MCAAQRGRPRGRRDPAPRRPRTVIAIELLAACQALDLHRPLTTTAPLEALYALVRKHVDPWKCDRQMAPDIKAVQTLVQSGALLEAVENACAAAE